MSCSSRAPLLADATVAQWKHNATAAYSIIHDDLGDEACDGILNHAASMANRHGVRIAAAAIASRCSARGEPFIARLRQFVQDGHELVSHSWHHGAAVDLGWTPLQWSVDTDVVASKRFFEEAIAGLQVTFFCFPYDAYNDARLDELRQNGYLGARAGTVMYEGDRAVNCDTRTFDPLRCMFDAYHSRAEQDAIDAGEDPYTVSIYDDSLDDVELQHVVAALACGGWSLQEMHTVSDTAPWGWGHISIAHYDRLLEFVKARVDSNLLWMETPTAVVRYIMTRNGVSAVRLTNDSLTLEMDPAFDARYATPLTIVLNAMPGVTTLSCLQGGTARPCQRRPDGRFCVELHPLQGTAIFSRS